MTTTFRETEIPARDVCNPIERLRDLRQCLARDKVPLGLFLGAGCPVAVKVHTNGVSQPLIPSIDPMTTSVCEILDSCKCADYEECLRAVKSHFEADGKTEFTIEDILSHVRSLRQIAGRRSVGGLLSYQLDCLDKKICEAVFKIVHKSLPASTTPYHHVAAWIGSTVREAPVQIFTTNYDLLMEQALEEQHIPYFDGFVGARRPFFDPQAMEEDKLPPRWARLWKLHGSINWGQDEGGVVWRGSIEEDANHHRVIYPSHLKYSESRRMPYLAMIDRLRAFLKVKGSVLVICGYSFRDEHLNEVIMQGLQGNATATAFALLYGPIQDYADAISLGSKRSNLAVMADDGGVLGTRRSEWAFPEDVEEGFLQFAIDSAVECATDNISGDRAVRKRGFALGDFARFGGFLEDLIGTNKRTEQI